MPDSSAAPNSHPQQRPSTLTGALIVGGLGAGAALTVYLHRRRRRRDPVDVRREALVTYLREHLSGSDAALAVVQRLRHAHAHTDDRPLFAELADSFPHEREVIRSLLAELGASAYSVKRVAGHASGSLLSLVAGGERGELGLLRTLEALSIGVQGKRCLWRALQAWRGTQDGQRYRDLEARALRQWDAIEARRLEAAAATFPAERAQVTAA